MQLTPVDYDPFEGEVQPAGAQTSAPRLTPVEGNPFESEQGQATLTPVNYDPFKGQAPSKPNAVTRGFMTGFFEQNPELGAEALEGASHLAPEMFKGPLRSGSEWLRGLPKAGAEYAPQAPQFRDIANLDQALTWAGEALGSGVASTLPSIATGLAGAGVGGAIAGPPGAIAGAAVGGISGGLPFNYGEVYRELKREGLAPDVSAQYAGYAAPVMAALDAYSVGKLAQQFGVGEVKRQAARIMARRIIEESA